MGCGSSKEMRQTPEPRDMPKVFDRGFSFAKSESCRSSETEDAEKLLWVQKLEETDDFWEIDDMIRTAPAHLRADRGFVLRAVGACGLALQYVSEALRSDPAVVREAVKNRSSALQYAHQNLQSDPGIVLTAVKSGSHALRHASMLLRCDCDFMLEVLQAVGSIEEIHPFIDPSLFAQRKFVLAAVRRDGMTLQYAHDTCKSDSQIVIEAVKSKVLAFQYASKACRANWDVVLAAVKARGRALQFAEEALRDEREIVLAAVDRDGEALQHASRRLRSDKHVVLVAIGSNALALRHAADGLPDDADCLAAASLGEAQAAVSYPRTERVILSIKMGTDYATSFVQAMAADPFLGQFRACNPNEWCRRSCDPTFTDASHPCRGTRETCSFAAAAAGLGAGRKGHLWVSSCWRVAFRFHIQECKESIGFMVQVQEKAGLSDGQRIETILAEQVGLKIFRTITTLDFFYPRKVEDLSSKVAAWYESGCTDMREQVVA